MLCLNVVSMLYQGLIDRG